ncbi:MULTISPECIES: GntR family transcriptional regulator [Bacillaceae]|uniref:GntR family transcriptional regulator n=1 Tax=Bacillaceae TaxID=186817 RepID=UPI001BDF1E7F|nr:MULTISPECIES: GntR family transcriptional regulator [Bacillaceae]MDX8362326.1 GntR family transcriptional regulator [Cytobacillus sp. IB215316]MDX8367241.1 GntR family transcriptional regulator [Cytobacillus sp. IB215665]
MEDFQANRPIYMQLVDRISHKIVRGELKPGDKLKSVREMAVESGVNPNTVQRTYSEMERVGIVETRRGQGTFVSESEERLEMLREQLKSNHIMKFIQEMTAMGFKQDEIIRDIQSFMVKENMK